jgi:hypothetical protein
MASHATGAQRHVVVEPLEREVDLRQYDWVEANRERISKASSGRIGYIFLSDFSRSGSEDFLRQFYPQLDKQGLIIDIRWNRGGFTSQFVTCFTTAIASLPSTGARMCRWDPAFPINRPPRNSYPNRLRDIVAENCTALEPHQSSVGCITNTAWCRPVRKRIIADHRL